jgi:glutamate-1-semialdehyde 2,1-aminomutase
MRAELAARGLACSVSRLAGMVDLKFLPEPPRDYDAASRADKTVFARYYHAMHERGVLLAPSANELMFLSSAHGPRELELTLRAFAAALDEVFR